MHSFTSLPSFSPPDSSVASMARSLEGESRGGVTTSPPLRLILVSNIPKRCCGLVGASGTKFCLISAEDCSIKSHAKKFGDFKEGFYVLAGTDDQVAFTEPFLAESTVSDEVKARLTARSFSDHEQIHQLFAQIEDSDVPFLTAWTDIQKDCEVLDNIKSFKTPMKRKAKSVIDTVVDKLGELNTRVKFENSTDEADSAVLALFESFVKEVRDLEPMVMSNTARVDSVIRQIGNHPVEAAPTVWMEISALKDNLIGLDKCKEDASAAMNLVKSFANAQDRLVASLKTSFSTYDGYIAGFKAQLSSIPTTTGGSMPIASDPSILRLESEVARLDGALKVMLTTGKPSDTSSVSFGSLRFRNIDEVALWCDTNLPPSKPFGCFTDVYSILQRLTSYNEAGDVNFLKRIETTQKLDLAADEALTVEAFGHPLPKGFYGSHKDLDWSTHYYLPGLKSKENWEATDRLTGLKSVINENTESLKSRIKLSIQTKLGGYPAAANLATELMKDSFSFITSLVNFIDTTYNDLLVASFPEAQAWKIVSRLVHRCLGVDCWLRRAQVKDFLDTKDARSLSATVLWGVMATHEITRDYERYDIGKHPSITSEYVRFWITNSGVEKVGALEARVKSLESQLAEALKAAKGASTAAAAAMNKVDQLAKKTKVDKD